MRRKSISPETQKNVLVRCARRCCLCYGLQNDFNEKRGQIAHIDRERTNDSEDNLVYLCLEHHDLYDSVTSQSKGITKDELVFYRELLHTDVAAQLPRFNSGPYTQKKNWGVDVRDFIASLRQRHQIQSSLLNGFEIQRCLEEQLISIDPFDQKHLRMTGYELSAGESALLNGRFLSRLGEAPIELQPGSQLLITSREAIVMPRGIIGKISHLHQQNIGGVFLTTPSSIDPGFMGHLVVGLRNMSESQVSLATGAPIAYLEFSTFSEPPESWVPNPPDWVPDNPTRHGS